MAIGALKTLLTTLQASAFLTGVTVVFGEEMIAAQDVALPMVVLVPRGGPWALGYVRGMDPSIENIWSTSESMDVYLWATAIGANMQPVDHADAVETLRQRVMSAFQDQRVQANTDGSSAIGLYWKPVSGRWELFQNAVNRYGRTYVLTVIGEIAVPMTAPVEATITTVTVNQTVSGGQHVA